MIKYPVVYLSMTNCEIRKEHHVTKSRWQQKLKLRRILFYGHHRIQNHLTGLWECLDNNEVASLSKDKEEYQRKYKYKYIRRRSLCL